MGLAFLNMLFSACLSSLRKAHLVKRIMDQRGMVSSGVIRSLQMVSSEQVKTVVWWKWHRKETVSV